MSIIASDKMLMRQICKGKHSSFVKLLERHQSVCYRIAWRSVFCKDEAQDIVQATFLKIWQYPYKWDASQGTKFSAWLYRMIVNASYDFNRKNKKTVLEVDSSLTLRTHLDKTQTTTDINDEQQQLMQHLKKLSQIQQQVINLFYYEDLPIKQTAEILQLSKKSVESHLARARKQLFDLMEVNYAK
jgi:RNA polymerase sigma-70 factor (ECF subfamily)